jgi:hypothetical protein
VAKLRLVQDPAADALLDDNPLALLIGMLLDHPLGMATEIRERIVPGAPQGLSSPS